MDTKYVLKYWYGFGGHEETFCSYDMARARASNFPPAYLWHIEPVKAKEGVC